MMVRKKIEPIDYILLVLISISPFLAIRAFGFTFWVDLTNYASFSETISGMWAGEIRPSSYMPSYRDGWSVFPSLIWLGLQQFPIEARWYILSIANAVLLSAGLVFLAVQLRLLTQSKWVYWPVIFFAWHPMTRALAMSINSELPSLVAMLVCLGVLLCFYRKEIYTKLGPLCLMALLIMLTTICRANAGAMLAAALIVLTVCAPGLSWRGRLILPIIPTASFAVGFLVWPIAQYAMSGQFIMPGNEMGALAAALSNNCSPSQEILDHIDLPGSVDREELLSVMTTRDNDGAGHRFIEMRDIMSILKKSDMSGHEIRTTLKSLSWQMSLDPPYRLLDRLIIGNMATGLTTPARVLWSPIWRRQPVTCRMSGIEVVTRSRKSVHFFMDLEKRDKIVADFDKWFPTDRPHLKAVHDSFSGHIHMRSRWERDPFLFSLVSPTYLANIACLAGLFLLVFGGPWRLVLVCGAMLGVQTLVFFIAYLGGMRYAIPVFPVHLILLGLIPLGSWSKFLCLKRK